MGHAAQARAVPVDLARLRVERALLVGLVLEVLGRRRRALRALFRSGARGHGYDRLCGIGRLLLLSLLLLLLPLLLSLADLGADGVEGGEVGFVFFGLGSEGDCCDER